MKNKTAIQISIPEPCTQAWDEMQPVKGGRHCAHRQKIVVVSDLTPSRTNKMLPAECQLLIFCLIFLRIMLCLSICSATALAQSTDKRHYKSISDTVIQTETEVDGESYPSKTIYGRILDENSHPVANVILLVSEGGIPKSEVLTDALGAFRFGFVNDGRYEVKLSFNGKAWVYHDVIVREKSQKLDIRLCLSCAFIYKRFERKY